MLNLRKDYSSAEKELSTVTYNTHEVEQKLEELKKCTYPHIAIVHELLHDKDNYYIVSQDTNAKSLYDLVIKHGPLHQTTTAVIVKQVLVSLNYMHKQNIGHYDLIPQNVMLEGELKTYRDPANAD